MVQRAAKVPSPAARSDEAVASEYLVKDALHGLWHIVWVAHALDYRCAVQFSALVDRTGVVQRRAETDGVRAALNQPGGAQAIPGSRQRILHRLMWKGGFERAPQVVVALGRPRQGRIHHLRESVLMTAVGRFEHVGFLRLVDDILLDFLI